MSYAVSLSAAFQQCFSNTPVPTGVRTLYVREYAFVPSSGSVDAEETVDLRRRIPAETRDAANWGESLGLHWENGSVRASHFVGAVWLKPTKRLLDEEGVPENAELLAVVGLPKPLDGQQDWQVDSVAIFEYVAQHAPEMLKASECAAGRGQQRLFEVFPDQAPIRTGQIEDLAYLQVVFYLRELASFCQRSLRQEFKAHRENLTGRVKGRVLISDQLRDNVVRGRADRVYCGFDVMTLDTPANRILRWALHLSLRFLAGRSASANRSAASAWLWARQAEAALSSVALTRISVADFRHIRYAGLMSRYRRIHALARMIVKKLRCSADGHVTPSGETLPFYLDMNQLFESYVGACLKAMGMTSLQPQVACAVPWRSEGSRSRFLSFRPDFFTECLSVVVDAKYKAIFDAQSNDDTGNWDVYQVLAYLALLPSARGSKGSPKNTPRWAPDGQVWGMLVYPKVAESPKLEEWLESMKGALTTDAGLTEWAHRYLSLETRGGETIILTQLYFQVPSVRCPKSDVWDASPDLGLSLRGAA